MRKFGLFLLALLLFFSLLSLAFSTSSNIAFTHPKKVESWLNDSNLYGAFVANAIDQAQKTTGADGSGGVSLSDTAVKSSAQSAFSAQALQKDVDTVINSNYAWLDGKTDKPSFNVNLSGAKQNFADSVGQYVTNYLKGLPACTAAQTAAIDTQTADPLTLTCRPANVDPTTMGAQVSEQIASNGNFLSDPVVTADNINPDGTQYTAPYYQRLSSLPQAYQVGKKIPWTAGAAALASIIGIIFLASRKRKGLKIIAVILALDGLILVVTKFTSDFAFNKVEHRIFNEKAIGELQKALTTFFNHAEDQLTKVDLWFGIGYLVLATIILIALLATRGRTSAEPVIVDESDSDTPSPTYKRPTPAKAGRPPVSAPPKPTAPPVKKPVRRKPPRLVQ